MIIDGTNLILGRVATVVAKKALEGESVAVVNCENIIISGKRAYLIERYKAREKIGHPYHGPFFEKMPDRLVKRAIRGMLTYKQARGLEAFKRIKCYIGVPDEFKSKKLETIKEADASKLKTLKYLKIGDISAYFGKKF